MQSKKSIRNTINFYAKSPSKNRSHYLKWKINDEWSVRYFFVFDKKPQFQKKFVLKSHYTKDYIEIPRTVATDYILILAEEKEPEELFSVNTRIGYRRLIIKANGEYDCVLEKFKNKKRKKNEKKD